VVTIPASSGSCEVVAQGEHGQHRGHRHDRQLGDQNKRAQPPDSEAKGNEAGASPPVGQPADGRAEGEAGEAVAEDGQADADFAQAIATPEVSPIQV